MNLIKQKNGFTIIETMIAISLFLAVTMTGLTALLNANLVHQKSRNMRSVMDSLTFIMEDMSRNMRTGYNYRCFQEGESISSTSIESPRSCEIGYAIAFENDLGDPNSNTDQWVYKVESPFLNRTLNIYKSVASGASGSWIQLNPSEVEIDSFSGFVVSGAEPPDLEDPDQQPIVTIIMSGKITFKGTTTPFYLRTSVSQRGIDI